MSGMDTSANIGDPRIVNAPAASSSYTPATIPCCECGALIQANPANTCVNCLKSKVDITDGITKQVTLFWCRGCGRYQRPPYVHVELESREMLALCLQKIKGLNKEVKLVDASFIWTEPHSKRIKVKLTIQKEVFHGAILQQMFVVEFVVQNQQCTDCQKSYTEHTWAAVVQIRQPVEHKKTMLYLEQMLLKHNVCEKAQTIKEMPGGMDIYWASRNGANHLVEFLKGVVPVRTTVARKLISQDINSNTNNYKFSMFAEIAPICKDDLVALEPKLASMLGGVSQLMLCTRITAGIHLLDPISLKIVEVSGGTYFHHRFRSQVSAKQLTEYVVLDIEKMDSARKEEQHGVVDHRSFNKQKLALNAKMCMAVCTVARVSDMGKNDTTFEVKTHLGHMLNAGDTVMGYDISRVNFNDEIKVSRKLGWPQVVLVRKSYPKRNRSGRRNFALKHLPKEEPDAPLKKLEIQRNEQDLEEFMNDIEEDPELQGKVNLYKRASGVVASARAPDQLAAASSSAAAAAADSGMAEGDEEEEEDDEDFPQIDMDALLDDMGAVTIGAFDEAAGKEVFDTDNEDAETEAPPQAAAAAGAAAAAPKSANKVKGRK